MRRLLAVLLLLLAAPASAHVTSTGLAVLEIDGSRLAYRLTVVGSELDEENQRLLEGAANGDPAAAERVATAMRQAVHFARGGGPCTPGRIRFQGTEDIDPLLDLTASRVISGVEAFIHVRGSMLRPELSFSSNPPQDESDILSLIIFGVPTNELGEGQQVALATRAQELAGGYLASGLSEAIGNALNLDEFEIQAAGENGLGPSIMVGQQVAKGLFVRLRQGFG